MYFETVRSGKYESHLLRESYREGGKIKHRTIANLSHCSREEIEAIKLALKHKDKLEKMSAGAREGGYGIRQGLSYGAVACIADVAERLGIRGALGDSDDGRMAMWQVAARVIGQGSRLSAVRLAGSHAAYEVFSLTGFDENDLYRNLDWVQLGQQDIEDKLFEKRGKPEEGLFLYDVTSSYLEGEQNELAEFGYNRDGKKGKKQIVIGLLCDGQGWPLSIEVFPGNTSDTVTFGSQVKKAAERFGGGDVTFVGDRGMIRAKQISSLLDNSFHYITALTKPQVEKLLSQGIIQMGLFDEVLAEVEPEGGGIRYVLRRNPVRAEEMRSSRLNRVLKLAMKTAKANQYLASHPKASPQTAARNLNGLAGRLKLSSLVDLSLSGRKVEMKLESGAMEEEEKLDGCYVLKTDLSGSRISKETVHSRYKDLSGVEQAFRVMKTVHLELRPVYVRLEERTRAHALIVMMAYMIRKELARCWAALDCTVEEGLNELSSLCLEEMVVNGETAGTFIPEPRELVKKLLEAAGVKLPERVPQRKPRVATRRKLPSRRNPKNK